jgi:hypothetical protein
LSLGPLDLAILFLSTQALMVLGIHGVVKTVKEEAEHQKGEGLQPQKLQRVFLQHFRNILGQRDIILVVLSISILAGIAWAVNAVDLPGQRVQVWAFSLALIEALILFFTVEVLYLLSWKWLPIGLKRNQLFRRGVDIATLTGALLFSLFSVTGCMVSIDLSCSVFRRLGDLVFATFFIAFFISGFGEMAIVDTISDTLSSHVPLRRRPHFLYIGLLLCSMAALTIVASIGYLFGPGTGYVIIGAEFATGFGIAYWAYLLIKRREQEHFSTLVYGVLMFGLSGLFFAYSFRNLVPPNLSSPTVSTASPTDLVLPLTLFAIGFLSLSIEIPKSAERKLGMRHDRLVACLTFLMVFTVVANYQRAIFSGIGTAIFFFQQGVPVGLGLWAGAIVFGVRKVESARERGRVKTERVVPACANCGQRLEPTSKHCWSCGSRELKNEKVLFAGNAKQILEVHDHHSRKRKLASLLTGGPIGFMAFGLDTRRRPGPPSQIVVTKSAAYFGGKTYPLNRILDVKPGHYSNSLVLKIGDPVAPEPVKPRGGNQPNPTSNLELKTSNPVALSRALKQAAPQVLQSL